MVSRSCGTGKVPHSYLVFNMSHAWRFKRYNDNKYLAICAYCQFTVDNVELKPGEYIPKDEFGSMSNIDALKNTPDCDEIISGLSWEM